MSSSLDLSSEMVEELIRRTSLVNNSLSTTYQQLILSERLGRLGDGRVR